MPLRSLRSALLVTGLYAALVLVLTFPQVFFLSQTTLGEPGVDKMHHLWDLWWWYKALVQDGRSPMFTDYCFYPPGLSLWRANSGFLLFHLSVLLHLLLGDVQATYNLMVMLSMLISCWGGYSLGMALHGDREAAFFTGAVVAFNAFVFIHVQIALMEFVNLGLVMLFVGSTLRFFQRRDARSAAASWLWYAAATTWAWYTGFMLLFFVALSFVMFLRLRERLREPRSLVMPGVWLAGILLVAALAHNKVGHPDMGKMIRGLQDQVVSRLQDQEVRIDNDIGFLSPYKRSFEPDGALVDMLELKMASSLDPLAIFSAPSTARTIFAFQPVRWALLLLLAGFAVLRLRDRMALFCVLLIVLAVALALGPCLIAGNRVLWGTCSLTPYSLLARLLPGLNRVQFPYRMLLLAVIGITVLASLGLKHLLARAGTGRLKRALLSGGGVALAILPCLDICGYPMLRTAIAVPRFFQELSADPEDSAIIEVPFVQGACVRNTYALSRFAYYQTTHHKRRYSGPIPEHLGARHYPPEIEGNAILKGLSRILQGTQYCRAREAPVSEVRTLKPEKLSEALADLRHHRFRYIVLHEMDMEPLATDAIQRFLLALPGKPMVDETVPQDRLIIYRLDPL